MEKSGNSRLAQTSRVCGIMSLNNDVMYTDLSRGTDICPFTSTSN